MEKEVVLVREDGSKPAEKPSGDISSDSYRLYFKGLINNETTELLAGFGVAICRQDDDHNILFQMKGSLHESAITVLEAELTALKRGLTEAVGLGITHISIYCDYQQVFELVMGRSSPEKDKIALLMNDVQSIRQQLRSSNPILVTRDEIKFAYKLALETINSEVSLPMPPDQKNTCHICFDDDFKAEQMFSIALCSHQFCEKCMKRHIEVRLLEGGLPRCPHDQCASTLSIGSCVNILTPKLREMWERRIEEESIPVAERVYCPNPMCSALVSKTELSESMGEDGVRSCCVKCSKPFCINCKVPWHSNLSCSDNKRLGPNPTENDVKLQSLANQNRWRQCQRCQHMIELSQGCIHVTCRCGHQFCYICGAQWTGTYCTHSTTIPPSTTSWWLGFLGFLTIWIILILWAVYRSRYINRKYGSG